MASIQDLKTITAASSTTLHLKLKNVADASAQTEPNARRARRASLIGRRSLSIDFDDTSMILNTRATASEQQVAETARQAAAPALIVQAKTTPAKDWQAPDPSAIAVAYTVTGDPVGPGPAARRTRYTTYVWSTPLPPAVSPEAVSPQAVPVACPRSPARGSPATAHSVGMQANTRVTSYRVFDKDACLASAAGGARKPLTSYRRLHLWRERRVPLGMGMHTPPSPIAYTVGLEAATGLALPPPPCPVPPPVMPVVMDRGRAVQSQSWQCAPCTQ